MRGSISRRGDAWQLRAYAGRDSVTNREVRRTRTFHGSKREAEAELARWVAEFAPASGAATTLSSLLRDYLDLGENWSATTRAEHRRIVEALSASALGRQRIHRLDNRTLTLFYAALRQDGWNGRPLQAGSVRRVHVVLHAALNLAVDWGWLSTNPATRAKVPPGPRRHIIPPSVAEVAKLLIHLEATDFTFYVYIRMAAITGARRSELCALRWADVVGGVCVLRPETTKTNKARRIRLDPATVMALGRLRLRAEGAGVARGRSMGTSVFCHDFTGAPWWPTSVSRKFRLACAEVGLEGVRLHDLRHFVATQLIAAGEDIRTVADRLGHASPTTTLNIYAAALAERQHAATDILAGLLD